MDLLADNFLLFLLGLLLLIIPLKLFMSKNTKKTLSHTNVSQINKTAKLNQNNINKLLSLPDNKELSDSEEEEYEDESEDYKYNNEDSDDTGTVFSRSSL